MAIYAPFKFPYHDYGLHVHVKRIRIEKKISGQNKRGEGINVFKTAKLIV